MISSADCEQFLAGGTDFVRRTKSAKEAISTLVERAAACVGSDMGSFYLLEGGVLRPFVTFNFPNEYAAACHEVPVGHQCCGRAALHKMPWIVADMTTDPLFAEAKAGATAGGVRSGFSVPVLDSYDNCLGALGAQFKTPHLPSAEDLEWQALFARLIAFALFHHGVARPAAGRYATDADKLAA